MTAWWRSFPVFSVRGRDRRIRLRRVPILGIEHLEDRRLLAGLFTNPGFGLSAYELTVAEGGAAEAFDVVLTGQPSSDVVLDVSSSNPGEAEVWPVRLTFTPGNWDLPQSVLVTAVDDNLIDGPQMTAVTVRIDQDASDSSFSGVSDQVVYVSTLDDDIGGFVLSKAALEVSESGTTDTFTVVLTARPNADVTLVAISGNEAEATLHPAVLTFAPADWNQPQTVTVTGVDDPRIDGDQTTLVTVGVAAAISDGHFAELGDQTVSVITMDDDAAGFVLSKTVAVVSESGTTDTFTVVLTAQPETHVTLTVSGSDASEATASPAVLVFWPAVWNSPQTVTITGIDDSERDGAQESLVTIAVDADQSDGRFADVAAQAVSVTTLDNDYGWHNVDNPFDTDGDGFVTAQDVLILINYINDNSGNTTLPSSPVSPPPYYDVNDDNLCTALDILMVINWINTQSAASSSGEGEGISRDASPAATAVPLEARRSPAVQPVFATAERLSDPIAAPRPASAPIPPPATRLQASFSSAKPGRPLHRISPDWTVSVDAALEIWEPEWDEVAGLPSAA